MLHVIFGIHIVISESEDKYDTWTDEREYAIITNTKLGLTVNLFSLNPEDLLDFEELVNSCNHIVEEFDPTYSQHFCGVHKAIIPIARMREWIDEDAMADTITYRCPDCS